MGWKEKLKRIKGPLLMVLITLSVYLCFRYLLGLIFPFLVAYFLAWIIRPVTETLFRRFKIPRIVGGTAALLLLVAVFGTSICLLIRILIKQTIALIKNLPIYLEMITARLDVICNRCDALCGMEVGTMRTFVDDNLLESYQKARTSLMPTLTAHTISITIWSFAFFGVLLIIFVAAVLMAKDLPVLHERFEKLESYQDIHRITKKLSDAGMAYLRSQLIIMLIVAVVCVLGLTLLHNNYAFLIGIGIALMDALPLLGSGIVFLPWAVMHLINGNIYRSAILVTLYLICQIIREVLEPKLIGRQIGIKPLLTLIAMYIGVKLFSVVGFFLGPIGIVIITTIYKVVMERSEETAEERCD